MYLTIAEYNDGYLRYLQNKIPLEEADYLTMHRFGPFNIDQVSHLDLLGGVLRILIPYASSHPPTAKSRSPSPPRPIEAVGQSPARSIRAHPGQSPPERGSPGEKSQSKSRDDKRRQSPDSKGKKRAGSKDDERGRTPYTPQGRHEESPSTSLASTLARLGLEGSQRRGNSNSSPSESPSRAADARKRTGPQSASQPSGQKRS
jgi:hypothetical protein